MIVLLWAAVWCGVAVIASLVIGRAVRVADVEFQVATLPCPDTVPEEWLTS